MDMCEKVSKPLTLETAWAIPMVGNIHALAVLLSQNHMS